MRIAFVIGSLAGGGAERVVSELATEMSYQGHDVAVIVVSSDKRKYFIPESVKFINCAKQYKMRGFAYFNRLSDIRKEIKNFNTEVCISFNTNVNFYSILATIGLKCPLVLSERNDPKMYPKDKISRIVRKLLYRKSYKYVFQTDEVKSYFSSGIQKNSCVIYNPLNPSLPDVYDGQRSKRFVTAVRLEPQKNIKMAIDAFALSDAVSKGFVFEIYGEGSLRSELTEYIKSQNLTQKVFLMGNSEKLYDDILDAYAFLLSSDFEGLSNSMLESMALGIPTISTDYPSGGARAVIDSGNNGIIVPVGDASAMRDAINKLVSDRSFALSISKNSQQIRHRLSVKKITEEWISFVKK